MNNLQKQQIASTVIKVLLKRFETFPIDATNNRNAPFHEAFLNAFKNNFDGKVSDIPFFISLSSWLHGLNTTLGQTFFEKVAHILSNGEKREYTSKKLGNLKIYQSQKDRINKIMTELSNSERVPNLTQENAEIFFENSGNLTNAIDFSADLFIEDNDSIIAIELKSVKPNSGEMKGEKQKILEGKMALKKEFFGKEIYFYIGFPFDPTSSDKTGYNKTRFLNSIINMTKFFDPSETLVASELWDKLSGESVTMEQILEIINTISTPDFIEKFQFLNNPNNRSNSKYSEFLQEWFLFSEIEILKNDKHIQEAIENDKKLQKIYHQQIFKNDEYNWQRSDKLFNLLK
ncbi:TdeIII family type II restriction endonuclease [Candidatus Gracilibacteria bacterium]|nr:TdeIII family type II restriction endonuclease [Candidatus Gracilibacteria bacterium]